MKTLLRTTLALAVLAAPVASAWAAESSPAGYVDFGTLTPAENGGEFVEVNLKGNLLGMAARLAAKEAPEAADLLKGIQSIHVNVVGLDRGNRAATEARIKDIRGTLDAQGWERIVTVKEKDQDVGIFLKTRGQDAVEGLVVTVIEGGQRAVLVNIVGDIRPEKLAALGERLHLDPLKKFGHTVEKK